MERRPMRPANPQPPRGASAASPPAGDYPLPRATGEVLRRQSQGGQPYVGSNLSLALNKLVGPWPQQCHGRMNDGDRRRFLERCVAVCKSGRDWPELVPAFFARCQAMLASYQAAGWEVLEQVAQPEWRFVSGLGMASSLETNLALHRTGGFPYIPGSSIKGAVRAYAELALDMPPTQPDAPGRQLLAPIRQVFGAQAEQGQVIFFDALPANAPMLELDVINVHYPDYYQQGKAPTDWQSPKPVLFLAVSRQTRFGFAVASRSPELARQAMTWLREALETTGLGAKTAAGYGYFQPVSEASRPPAPSPRDRRRASETGGR